MRKYEKGIFIVIFRHSGYNKISSRSVFHISPEGGRNVKNGPDNTKSHDNGAKLIFDAPILCAQFLRGYTDMCIMTWRLSCCATRSWC